METGTRLIQYPIVNFLEAHITRERDSAFRLSAQEFEFYGKCVGEEQVFKEDDLITCFFCTEQVAGVKIASHLRMHARDHWQNQRKKSNWALYQQELLLKRSLREIEQVHSCFLSAVPNWDLYWFMGSHEERDLFWIEGSTSIKDINFEFLHSKTRVACICRPCDEYTSLAACVNNLDGVKERARRHLFQHFIDFDYEFFWENYTVNSRRRNAFSNTRR